jgi:hypothetical protein
MQTDKPFPPLQLPETGAARFDVLPLLIACSQAEPSPEDIGLINTFLSTAIASRNDTVLSTVVAVASQHGVLPTVYKTLRKLSQEHRLNEEHSTTLQPLIAELKSAYMQIARRNMMMTAELLRIVKLLEQNGIMALPFKGPTLAQLAYGDITLRQFGDLDILIKQADVEMAAELLESSGYQNTLQIPQNQEERWYRRAKDMVLFHPGKQIYVELHWHLLDEDHPVKFDARSVWENPQTVMINGQAIRTFSNESLVCYLGIHGSKHLWERLGWIKDIDQMVRTGAIDWERIHTGGGERRMLLLGFYLADDFFRTPLPNRLHRQIDGPVWLSELRGFILGSWNTHGGMFSDTAAMLRLFPTLRMKLRYLHKVIITPSKHEYRFADFPKGLHWLYYIVRLYLLIRKYLGIPRTADR